MDMMHSLAPYCNLNCVPNSYRNPNLNIALT